MTAAQAVMLGVEILEALLKLIPEHKRDEVHARINLALVDADARMQEAAQAALDAR